MSQDNQQELFTLHNLAEQAQNPNADPQVIMQHLSAHMEAMNHLQQQFTNMQQIIQQQQQQITAQNDPTAPIVTLSAAIEALAGQNREHQQMQQVFQTSLQSVLDRLAQRSPGQGRPSIPLPLGTKFKGSSEEFTFAEFKAKLYTVFARFPDSMATDKDKINYAIQSMEGAPSRHFAPYINGEIADEDGILEDYQLFLDTVDEFHGDRQEQDEVNHKLARLRQTHSMTEYVSQFRTLAARSGWNEAALLARFKDGLSSEIKDLLLPQWNRYKTVRELQSGATTAYQNLQSRNRHRPRQDHARSQATQASRRPTPVPVVATPPSPNSMDLDSMRVKHISAEEKQRRRDLGLCLYCGGENHFAQDCPAKKTIRVATVITTPENFEA